jgi:hypothetical protein
MKNLILFCFISSILSFNLDAQSGWIEKKSEIGNFYLTYPNPPTYTSGSFHGWTAKDKSGQVTYMMAFMEAPSNVLMSMTSVEKFLLPSMMEGDIQVSKNYLTYNNYNAMDFLYKTNRIPVLYKKGRAVIRDQRLYILQVQFYNNEIADFDKFSKSLKFY